MLNYYDFTADVSGAEFRISAAGSYLRYYSGSALGLDNRIVVKCDARALSVILKPGQAIRLDAADGKAVDWRLANYAKAASISGLVVIGDGKLDDSTVAGEVSMIDGGLARTLGNQAFMATSSVGPVAGQLSHVQLWNPAVSGKNVFVESYSMSSTVAQSIQIGDYNAEYGTAGNAVMPKYGGSAVGVGVMRVTTNAGTLTTNGGPAFYVNANTPQVVNFREPYLIVPGRGLTVFGNTANAWLSANFEWYEQAP